MQETFKFPDKIIALDLNNNFTIEFHESLPFLAIRSQNDYFKKPVRILNFK